MFEWYAVQEVAKVDLKESMDFQGYFASPNNISLFTQLFGEAQNTMKKGLLFKNPEFVFKIVLLIK